MQADSSEAAVNATIGLVADDTGNRQALSLFFKRIWEPVKSFNATDLEFSRQLHSIRVATKRVIRKTDGEMVKAAISEAFTNIKDFWRAPQWAAAAAAATSRRTAASSTGPNAAGVAWKPLLDSIDSLLKPRYGLVVHDANARQQADGQGWIVPLQAWIFRRNEGRHMIRLALCQKLLIEAKHGIKNVSAEAQRRYEQRGRLIFRNLAFRGGECDRRLEVRFGDGAWQPIPTLTNNYGRVDAELFLSNEEASRLVDSQGVITIEVRSDLPDAETGADGAAVASVAEEAAAVRLVDPEGLIVISDLDDTVKVTEVFAGKDSVVRNTFFEEFRAVTGMAELFQKWAKALPGTSFHFVSNSPPELHEPLRNFLRREGFPLAPLHLRPLWGKDRKTFKESTIARILEQFPRRRFVLVGDSGERDPVIYAGFLRSHPEQVAKVLIRKVDATRPVDATVFDGLDNSRWQVFRESSEVDLDVDLLAQGRS